MKFYLNWILPRMKSGEIVECKRQVPYELQQSFKRNGKTVLAITYIADYVIIMANGHSITFDVKGSPDNISLLKRKLFWFKYPDVDYRWICYSQIGSDGTDGGWVEYEKVKQGRKERKKAKNAN